MNHIYLNPLNSLSDCLIFVKSTHEDVTQNMLDELAQEFCVTSEEFEWFDDEDQKVSSDG